MTILDEPIKINMMKVPPVTVEEGSVADYMCETNSFNHDTNPILWFVDDIPVDEHDTHTEVNYSSPGDYYGQMTNSTLRLTAKREMNNRLVKCVLKDNIANLISHNLNVTCEYLLRHKMFQFDFFSV